MKNKPHFLYGVLFAPIGLIVGIYLYITSIGDGYFIFIVTAPLAAFITGSFFWFLINRRKNAGYFPAVAAGILSGTVSHWLCWLITILVTIVILPGSKEDIIPPLQAIFAAGVYSVFSILFFGLFTVGWGVLAAVITGAVTKEKSS